MDRVAFLQIVGSQVDAGLAMLDECIRVCPADWWDKPVGVYPFWHVAYHVLCFVDVYSSRDNEAWKPDQRPDGLHPLGRTELEEEFPSRRFEQRELIGYVARCRVLVSEALAAETDQSLRGGSGFDHLRFTRAELYLYTLRHLQHHAGQLTATLRRAGVATRWRKAGWPAS